LFPPEIIRSHARLSHASEKLLAYVVEHPEGLARSTFAELVRADPMGGALQPWPIILSASLANELGRVASQLTALVRDLPARIFDRDPEEIASYYGISVDASQRILADQQSSRGFVRGDFILSEHGFSCLELNFPPHPRGTVLGTLEEAYRWNAWFGPFAREHELECPRSLDHFARHAVACLTELDLPANAPLHLALEIPHPRLVPSGDAIECLAQAYDEAVRAIGRRGRLLPVLRSEVEVFDDRAVVAGEIIAGYWCVLDAIELEPIARRERLHLYNGPAASLSNDKRTLALLSEHGESDRFTANERALIASHVPWTRRLTRTIEREGVTSDSKRLLIEQRADLVLKPARSFGGSGVVVGRFCEVDRWRAIVERAVSLGEWIVQAHVESLPFAGQSGEHGWARCDVVWGAYVDGSEPGGALVRCDPKGRNGGVINVRQGCEHALSFTARDT
jgi:hypothetical protein